MIRIVIGQTQTIYCHLGDKPLGEAFGVRFTNLVSLEDVEEYYVKDGPEDYNGRSWYKVVYADPEELWQQGMHIVTYYIQGADDSETVLLTQYAYVLNDSGHFLDTGQAFNPAQTQNGLPYVARTFDLDAAYYIAPDL